MKIQSLILTLLIIVFVPFGLTCSKKKSTTPESPKLQSGIVELQNQTTAGLKIRYHYQTRNGKTVSVRPYTIVRSGQSYILPNLMDGGIEYKGGDETGLILVCYFSNEEPEGRGTVTVDGDKHIVVSRRCNCTGD